MLASIVMALLRGVLEGFGQKPYLQLIIFFPWSSFWVSDCCSCFSSCWMCFWIDVCCVHKSLFLCHCCNFWYDKMGLCCVFLGFVVGGVGGVGMHNFVVGVECFLVLTME